MGVIVLGVTDRERAEAFWSAALGWDVRPDGFGGWVLVLTPPDGRGTPIALQVSETPPPDYPRLHLDLHVHSPPSRRRRPPGWSGSARSGWTGTASPTTRTSSCWPIPRATGSASWTSATREA